MVFPCSLKIYHPLAAVAAAAGEIMICRPISYYPDMIRAYMRGQKTQTRRTKGLNEINKAPDEWGLSCANGVLYKIKIPLRPGAAFEEIKPPYGIPGDRLWFRHIWYHHKPSACNPDNEQAWDEFTRAARWKVQIDGRQPRVLSVQPDLTTGFFVKKPSMFMPRWACHFDQIPILSVRLERLHDISEADVLAEGFNNRDELIKLWDKLNSKRGYPWSLNPWVWAYGFPAYKEAQG